MAAENMPIFSKIEMTWPELSIYMIQPALVNKPGIKEITYDSTREGSDRLEILLQMIEIFPYTDRVVRVQRLPMTVENRQAHYDIYDVVYAVDPDDDDFVASF